MGSKDRDEEADDHSEKADAEDKIDPDAKEEEEGEDAAAAGGTKRKRKRKRKKKSAEDEGKSEEQTTEAESQETDKSKSVECTVYVEGIPFDASPDQVKEFFQTQGSIDDVLEMRLPQWQDSGRLRGYGHVLFGSVESFEKALTLSGKHLGKRYLTIQAANAPQGGSSDRPSRPSSDEPPPKDCTTLFVNNLPYNASEDAIAAAFEGLAKGITITEGGVRIARNSVTRQSKGFCYVDFATPKDVAKVMKSTKNLSVGGRTLRLDYDTGRMKGSYRAQSGRLWTKESQERKRTRHN